MMVSVITSIYTIGKQSLLQQISISANRAIFKLKTYYHTKNNCYYQFHAKK